jgi:hypothetical protein
MANIVKELQINSFVKGLITEASPLTFPANASLDEENFVLNLDGSRARRLGLDYESGYAITTTAWTNNEVALSRISFHYWPNPGGSTTVSLGVLRIKDTLYFINLLATSPSNSILTSVTIANLRNSGDIQTAVINGIFVITSWQVTRQIIALSWLPATNTLDTIIYPYIQIRDFYGVYESNAVDTRPTGATITDIHNYNLQNQGWSNKLESTCGALVTPMQCTYNTLNPADATATARWPSNADIMYLGKVSNPTGATYEKFDPLVLYKNSFDATQAPKGHFIIGYASRNVDRLSQSVGVATLPADTESGTIYACASYASRIFYSGIDSVITNGDLNSPNLSGYILFSQIVTSKDKLGKCYQENDPTSPNISDILDTDGGTIHIPEASKIIKMIPYGTSLLVFAENGIWEITGENGVFKATSYQVNKVTNIGTGCPDTIIEGGGQLVYWANSGIYRVVPDATTGRLSVESVSISTIQTYYNNLSATCKQYAKGFYDERRNTIRWLFNDTTAYSSTSFTNRYNKQMNLDINLKAFYIYNLGDNSNGTSTSPYPYITNFINIPNYSSSTTNNRIEPYSLLTVKNNTFTISKYSSTRFKDWYTNDSVGVDYTSTLITGYEIFGDISHSKQIPFINFYFDRTEQNFITSGTDLVLDFPSSCLVQAQWDWCNSANSGKWGTQFQAYRLLRNYIPSGVGTFDYGERVIITKNKLRGSGRAISLKILSETGKDMKLLGWSSDVTVKPKV